MKYTYNKDNIRLLHGDSFKIMSKMKDSSVDVIITDPPYFLSNDGFSNSGGKQVSVNKGDWDKAIDFTPEEFYSKFLDEAKRILTKDGTICIFGSMHNIYIIGYLLGKKDFKVLNNITWQKSNPAPNLGRRMFTHSTETILWAKREPKSRQIFNYDLMREYNNGKQMKDVWTTSTIKMTEKRFGKHPTQKPIEIIERLVEAVSDENSLILDPFIGSGTTAVAGLKHNRNVLGIDMESEYLDIAVKRLEEQSERSREQ
ncbi:DNA-methyltransferase [Dellaglioa carnosa]|uniref:DNA-methyltransferase n=1 Tax=Dellaglioa carnosa TaxID=2995136 RepID=UPI0022A8413C|nr:site-specific DNA-methyltransferase [Dellaglioa carnosa]MCZ2492066.1 site-specific DNA-methyltransferase [Dellaglioa carnosa]